MATLEEQIRELEARRAKGEVVPKLDALYKKQDNLTRKGYDSVVNPDRPGKLSAGLPPFAPTAPTRAPIRPKDTQEVKPTPKQRNMPQEKAFKGPSRSMPENTPQEGITEMMAPMAPMETGRPNVRPRSMNADRDKAYDTDVELKKGGKVSSASKRADGCAIRGKTRA